MVAIPRWSGTCSQSPGRGEGWLLDEFRVGVSEDVEVERCDDSEPEVGWCEDEVGMGCLAASLAVCCFPDCLRPPRISVERSGVEAVPEERKMERRLGVVAWSSALISAVRWRQWGCAACNKRHRDRETERSKRYSGAQRTGMHARGWMVQRMGRESPVHRSAGERRWGEGGGVRTIETEAHLLLHHHLALVDPCRAVGSLVGGRTSSRVVGRDRLAAVGACRRWRRRVHGCCSGGGGGLTGGAVALALCA